MRFALRAAGALAFGLGVGSLAHLIAEIKDDVVDSLPSHRSSQLLGALEAGFLARVSLPDGRQVFVRDAPPTTNLASGQVALVIGSGLSASGPLVDSLCERGMRVLACEENLDVPAAGSTTASSIPARAELISAVLNDRQIDSKVVVVASALEWLPAVQFCARNYERIQGLLLIDPLLHGEYQFGGAESLQQAPAPRMQALSPLQAASEAITESVAAPSFALTLSTHDPLHVLEHVVTGKHHHHLFCGTDHGLTAPAASASAAPAAPGVHHPRSSVAPSMKASAASSSESDDTVDCTALLPEAVYRSHLYGLDHTLTLAEMLPTVSQSISPTLSRSGLHLGPFLDVPADRRIAALDARVKSNARACADKTAQLEWITGLQELSERLPVRVRITLQGEADLAEPRTDLHTGKPTSLTESEVELRLRLQADANLRIGHWQSVLPRRVTPIACAAPSSGRDVFEPNADAIASAAASMYAE